MIAGKEQIGYMGDMPAIIASSKPDVADIRIVAVAGTSQQQCNIFLVRKDAPEFKSPEEALKWFDGKVVASPQGSCTDRFARTVFQKLNIKPSKYFNQAGDAIAENFKAGKLDAAVLWEPIPAKFLADGVARRVASGVNFDEFRFSGFIVMRQDLIAARPDIEKRGSRPSSTPALPRRSQELERDRRDGREGSAGLRQEDDVDRALRRVSRSLGGSPDCLALDFVITPKLEKIVKTTPPPLRAEARPRRDAA